MFKFNHYNFNVSNLERSLAFYDEALGLKPVRRMENDGFILTFLGDGVSAFTLELTYLKERTEKYDLGEGEFHLAFETEDIDAAFNKHTEMGVVCFKNEGMGIYFIEDPDGFWIEIIPR